MCLTCGLSQFKKKPDGSKGEEEIKGPLLKVFWYLPIIHMFKLLFTIKEEAKNLTWHENGRKCDNLLRHLVDYVQWKKINKIFLKIITKFQ